MLKLAVKGDTMNPFVDEMAGRLEKNGNTLAAKMLRLGYLLGCSSGNEVIAEVPEGLRNAYDNERGYL
jgi:hypothetical protein